MKRRLFGHFFTVCKYECAKELREKIRVGRYINLDGEFMPNVIDLDPVEGKRRTDQFLTASAYLTTKQNTCGNCLTVLGQKREHKKREKKARPLENVIDHYQVECEISKPTIEGIRARIKAFNLLTGFDPRVLLWSKSARVRVQKDVRSKKGGKSKHEVFTDAKIAIEDFKLIGFQKRYFVEIEVSDLASSYATMATAGNQEVSRIWVYLADVAKVTFTS